MKKVLCYLFCFSIMGIGLFSAMAAMAVDENLDSYPTGLLTGNGTWNYESWNLGIATSSKSVSSPNSAFVGGYYPNPYSSYFTFASTTDEGIEFQIYPAMPDASINLMGDIRFVAGASQMGGLRFECWSRNCKNDIALYTMTAGGSYGTFLGYVPTNEWLDVIFENERSTGFTTITINGSSTAPQNLGGGTGQYATRIQIAHVYNNAADRGFYFDDFKNPYYGIAGYYPDLTPIWPVDCVFNATDTFSGSATGHLEVPLSSTSTWTKLTIAFKDANTGTSTHASTTFSLTSGQDIWYSIPYSLATSTYDVFYFIDGYACDAPDTCFNVGMLYSCPYTGLGTYQQPEMGLETLPEFPTQEDCSGYGLTDRLLCEIKNFVSGIFVPSPSEVIRLQETIGLVKQKAPYTYLNATKDFIIYLNSNISTTTPTIQISMFNATGTPDFSVFEATSTSFAGTTQVFKTFLRLFSLGLLIFLAFIPWTTNFLKRIFR